MEEILSSIRRIISEDETDAKKQQAEAPVDSGARAAAGASDVQDVAIAPPPAKSVEKAETAIDFQAAETGGQVAEKSAPEAPPAEFIAPDDADAYVEAPPSGEPQSDTKPEGLGAGFGAAFGAGFGGGPDDAPDVDAEEEVLDLTEMVASDGSVVKITPQGLSDGAPQEPATRQRNIRQAFLAPEQSVEQDQSVEEDSPALGSSFDQGARAEAEHDNERGDDAESGRVETDQQAEAKPGDVELAETDHGDEVTYSNADLNGTPAFMAATEAEDAAPESAASFDAPPASDDAFAELAGADEEDNEQAMSQNMPHDQAAPGQPAFASNGFQNTGADESSHAAPPMAGSNAGLDAMIQRMAEPMVRQWIEQNMPKMIEEIVREEVARRLTGG